MQKKKYVDVYSSLEKLVVLKEDEQGRYIEYFFKDGAPHDNRCLSWYCKPHPIAWVRNWCESYTHFDGTPYTKEEAIRYGMSRLKMVGHIYSLTAFTCGTEKYKDEKPEWYCTPGHCADRCKKKKTQCPTWTYEEPVKCGCWDLDNVDFEKFGISLTPSDLEKIALNS